MHSADDDPLDEEPQFSLHELEEECRKLAKQTTNLEVKKLTKYLRSLLREHYFVKQCLRDLRENEAQQKLPATRDRSRRQRSK